jgi:segregation and condensation protein B
MTEAKNIIEALLIASKEPLSIKEISAVLAANELLLNPEEIQNFIEELKRDYQNRAIEIKEVSGGYRFQTKIEYGKWVQKLWEGRPPRYSRAFLETLALIAFRQPMTRAEIEEVRGVSVSSNIMKTLLEREWVKVVGFKEVPGRPALFATTEKFLDYFNLKSLEELAPLLIDEDKIEVKTDDADANHSKIAATENDEAMISEKVITEEVIAKEVITEESQV